MADAQGEEGPRPPPTAPVPTTHTGGTPPKSVSPQREVVRQIIAEAWRFTGPIPPPELFAEYNKTLPGSADRILAMAEREQANRHDMVTRGLNNEHALATRGQTIAGVLGGMVILVGALGIYLGRPLEGLGAVLLATASLVTVFLVSKRREPHEEGKSDD